MRARLALVKVVLVEVVEWREVEVAGQLMLSAHLHEEAVLRLGKGGGARLGFAGAEPGLLPAGRSVAS